MKTKRILLAILLAAALIFSFPALYAEEAEGIDSIETSVKDSISKDYTVTEEDTLNDDAVTIGGNLEISGIVTGDAVCIGGTVDINGTVEGDLVLIGSAGKIGSMAVVKGSYVNIGSSIDIDSGAVFSGESTNISIGALDRVIKLALRSKYGIGEEHAHRPVLEILKIVSGFIVIYLISLAIVLLVRPHRRVESTLYANPFFTFLAGIGVQLLFVPAIVLLAISILGIPFIPLFILAVFAGLIFGAAVTVKIAGRWLLTKMNVVDAHPALVVLAGLGLLTVIPLLSAIINIAGVPYLDGLFGFLKFVQTYIVITYAFGAVFLSRFGTLEYIRGESKNKTNNPDVIEMKKEEKTEE